MPRPPDLGSNRPLLDKLGVKPGAKVVVLNVDDPAFIELLRERTADIVDRKPRTPCDLVFYGVRSTADLARLRELKTWIEPNGAVWVIRPKGAATPVKEMELMRAGADAGLVDNKIASFSGTHGAMRFVFRLKDRPR
jgi:hypothetical protein